MKINKKFDYKQMLSIPSLICSAIILFLITTSRFSSNNSLSIVLTLSLLFLLTYNLKFLLKNSKITTIKKAEIALLTITLFEIIFSYTTRELFPVYFLAVPLIYKFTNKIIGISALLIICVIELVLYTGYLSFYNIILLSICTIIFGNYFSRKTVFSPKNRYSFRKIPDDLNTDNNSNWEHTKKLITSSLKELKELLPSNSIVLYLKNKDGLFEINNFISNCEELIDNTQKLNFRSGYIGWTLKTKTPFVTGSIKNPRENITYYNATVDIRSLLAIPLIKEYAVEHKEDHNDTVGVLIVDSLEENAFTQRHKAIASILAKRINSLVSIYNLSDVFQENTEKLNSLYQYIQKLESDIDIKLILKNLMDTLDTIMAQEFVCFSVKKGNQSDILLTSSEDVILTNKSFFHAQSLVGLVSDSNKSLSFPDISERSKHRDVFNKEIDLALGIKSIKSALIFPISTSDDKKEDIFGATFIGRTQKYEFNEEQRQLSRILIQQAAKAIRYSTNVKEIKELAIKDGLSGLYNHRHFKELFSNIISRALRYPEKVSLILIDFDNFKQINDEYGHLAGDKIIKEIGKTIMESTRDIDISARYGGDEFAILLPNTNDHGSVVVANKIKSGFKNKEIIYNDVEIQAKFSVGIATFPDDAETIDQLFKKADSALYEAKRMGKDIILHSKEMINEKVISDKTH